MYCQQKIIRERDGGLIWGVRSWKFHVVREKNLLRRRSEVRNTSGRKYTEFLMIVFDVKTYLGDVFAAPSSSSGEEMMLPALCHQTTAPLLHFFASQWAKKKREKAQIPTLGIQKEMLHLLYVQPLMLLCFKLLGWLQVWPADCSDRHGGIWRWLPETTEEKGEDPESAVGLRR